MLPNLMNLLAHLQTLPSCFFTLLFSKIHEPYSNWLIDNKHCKSHLQQAQDEIARFRISETWRKHAAPWFRYIYVLRKCENSNLRDSVTSPERKCQVTFPSYLSQQISAVVRFRHVSANGSAVVCYIYQSINARWFFEQQ